MARNPFQSPLDTANDAFGQGYDRQQAVTDRITTTRAGGQLASGDRAAAASTFARGGMIPQARQIQGDAQAEDDRAYERKTAEEARAAKMKGQQAQALVTIAKGLREVPAGQRLAALKQALPVFQQIGVDPTPFSSLTEEQLTDDQLGLFAGEMEKQWQVLNLGNGGAAKYNNRTGDFTTLREPDPRPVIIGNGGMALDPETGAVIGRNAKTFAPARGRAGGKAAAAAPRPTGRHF